MSVVNRTKLNLLVGNLDAGKFAEPELLQSVVEEVYTLLEARSVETDVLLKTNATAYTPTGDYHPATKKFTNDEIATALQTVLTKTNTTPYEPATDYHPTTVKYVIDAINAAIVNIGGTSIIQTGTEFPTTPTAGQTFFKTDENRFYVYSGTAWQGAARQDYTQLVPYATATGTANTYAVTLNPAPAAYVEGMAMSVKINVQNTGAATINVNVLGAKSILKSNGNALASGNLKVNSVYTLRYNGTAFILQGEGGEYGTAGAAQVLSGYSIGTENGLLNGAIVNRGSPTFAAQSGNQALAAGHYGGGTIEGYGTRKRVAQGTAALSGSAGQAKITVSGLAFTPGKIIARVTNGIGLKNRPDFGFILSFSKLLMVDAYLLATHESASYVQDVSSLGGYIQNGGFSLYITNGVAGNQWTWEAEEE